MHPTTHTPTHGCGVSINHKSSNRIELSWFIQVLSHFNRLGGPPGCGWGGWSWVWVWVGGGISTNLKSSNRIEISWFIKFLLTFDWFQGCPLWGWGWLDGCETLSGCLGGTPCTCACAHICMHVRACVNDDIIIGFPRISLWEQPFTWNKCMHVHMCVCVHVHMHTCVGHPSNTLTESHMHPTTPTPHEGQTPEISQKSIKI